MKLSKMKWTVQMCTVGFSNPQWEWLCWGDGGISITGETGLKTESGCMRNFERFAKANGIKDFKYV